MSQVSDETPDDAAARSRAIFERWRSERSEGGSEEDRADGPVVAPEGDVAPDAAPPDGPVPGGQAPDTPPGTEGPVGAPHASVLDGLPEAPPPTGALPDDHSPEAGASYEDPAEPAAAAALTPPGATSETSSAPAVEVDEHPRNGDTISADPPLGPLPGADAALSAVAPPPRRARAHAAYDPGRRELPRIMAIANQKGGVGKTTTAVNLGACLAELDYRVLVIDLDPQGNASTGLGVNPRNLETSMYDVILNDLPLEDCVGSSSVRNLFVAPASLDLAGAEIELVPAFSRELKLRRALEEVADEYDFVLIDCPPSLGLLTVNGLAAATEVVVPIQCEYYALEGLGQLLRNVNLVQRNLNPKLEVSAIILVMYDARTKLSDQVVQEVRNHFGAKVCRNVVPRTVRLSEAPSFGQPIIAFDPSSRGAIAYRELAKEVSGGTPQRTR
jgi:chromosome partitioning protein